MDNQKISNRFLLKIKFDEADKNKGLNLSKFKL